MIRLRKVVTSAVLALAVWLFGSTGSQAQHIDPKAFKEFVSQVTRLVAQKKHSEAIALAKKLRRVIVRRHGRRNKDFKNVQRMLAALNGYRAAQLKNEGDYVQAERHAIEAVRLAEVVLGPAHEGYALTLNMLGEIYRTTGRLRDAEQLFRRALPIFERRMGRESKQVANVLNNTANVYFLLQRYGDAERLYERAISIWEKLFGPEYLSIAQTLSNLSAVYRQTGRLEQAVPLLERAVRIYDRYPKAPPSRIADVQSNLGDAHVALNQFEEAEQVYQRSLKIRRTALGSAHSSVAISLNNLAVLRNKQGRPADALVLYQKALDIRIGSFGKNHPRTASTLRNIGLVHLRQRSFEPALAAFTRAARIREARTLKGLDEKTSRSTGLRLRTRFAFYNLADAAAGLAAEDRTRRSELLQASFRAAQWAVRTKTQSALSQMSARARTGSAKLARLLRKRQDLVERLLSLNASMIKSLTDTSGKATAKLRRELAATEAELGKADTRIARRFPQYAELSNPKPLSVGDVQTFLGEDEALIAYLPTDDFLHMWALTRKQVTWKTVPLDPQTLADDLSALRKSLDPIAAISSSARGLARTDVCRGLERIGTPCETYDTDLERAHALYKRLLGPLQNAIDGKSHLMIVPAGALTSLPFHMLVTAPPPRDHELDERLKKAQWLIRKHAATILPSVSSLRALRAFAGRSRAKRPFVGIGNPEFYKPRHKPKKTGDGSQAGTRAFTSYFRGELAAVDELSGRIPPLPDTVRELRTIGKLFKARKRDLILGRRASETTLKRMSVRGRLDDYRVVHFATHGLVAGEVDGLAEPALILSLPSKATVRDDGLLTASEVAQLRLNADWVVLSACNTASGDKPGAEALSGLARAFFYSGTRALLVSHWPVISEAAVRLTTKTFSHLRSAPSAGRAEALRQAMLSLIDNGKPYQRHPSYWAPFIVVGEGGVPRAKQGG